MKKKLLILTMAFAALATVMLTSCKKEEKPSFEGSRNDITEMKETPNRGIDPVLVIQELARNYGMIFDFDNLWGPYSVSLNSMVDIYVVPSSWSIYNNFYLTFFLNRSANLLGIYVADLSYAFGLKESSFAPPFTSYYYEVVDPEFFNVGVDSNQKDYNVVFTGEVQISASNGQRSLVVDNNIGTIPNIDYNLFYNLSHGIYTLERPHMYPMSSSFGRIEMAFCMANTFYVNFYQ